MKADRIFFMFSGLGSFKTTPYVLAVAHSRGVDASGGEDEIATVISKLPRYQTIRPYWSFHASGFRRTASLRWTLLKTMMQFEYERLYSGGHGFHDAAGKQGC